MRVDLGGRDVGMAEHGLDGAKVGAPLEQVARERSEQGMRDTEAGDPPAAPPA